MLPSISIIPLLTALLAAHAETTEIAQPQPTGRVVVKLPKSQNLVTIEQDGATDSSSYNQPCKTQDTGVIKCLNESTLMVCDHGVWQFLSKCPTGTKCPDTRCMAKLDKVVQDTSSTSSTSTTDIPNIKVVDDSKIPNIIVDAKHKHVTDNSGTSVSMNMVGLAAVVGSLITFSSLF